MSTDAEELKRRYESFAQSLDYKTTASDYQLRELEIDTGDRRFRERLLRYARTVPRHADELLVFEYVSVVKRESRFDWMPVVEYRVNVDAGLVSETRLDPSFSPSAVHALSPVHEGALPGSYAPARR